MKEERKVKYLLCFHLCQDLSAFSNCSLFKWRVVDISVASVLRV